MSPENTNSEPGSPRYGYEDLSFEQMESHEVYGPIFQQAALNYLKSADSEYFNREFSGELDSEGYLLRKDGTNSNTRPSQNISGFGLKVVESATKEEIGKRLGKKN
ncbi:MAG TPA: hypothetical protein PK109_03595 [Candidatus Paceibacterota bacterium]|nr:hypothetical protein [Candidatus Paceibacterota bacterium]